MTTETTDDTTKTTDAAGAGRRFVRPTPQEMRAALAAVAEATKAADLDLNAATTAGADAPLQIAAKHMRALVGGLVAAQLDSAAMVDRVAEVCDKVSQELLAAQGLALVRTLVALRREEGEAPTRLVLSYFERVEGETEGLGKELETLADPGDGRGRVQALFEDELSELARHAETAEIVERFAAAYAHGAGGGGRR